MGDDDTPTGADSGDGVMQITPAAVESTDSPESDVYFVQVQSLADEMSAIQSVGQLKQLGHQAHVTESDVDGKIWYRVMIGGFPDRASAQTVRDTLSTQGVADTLIVKNGQ
jgi:cell division protein FtsN